MNFDIITIFPEIFSSWQNETLIDRAQKKNLIKINIHNLRDWTKDKHQTAAPATLSLTHKASSTNNALRKDNSASSKTGKRSECGRVDDRPFGGGFGMVLKVEPILKAVKELTRLRSSSYGGQRRKIALFTPRGKKFTQKMAWQFSKLDQLIMICGRYEGVDERVAKKIADIELSIGDYDLMGGELPAMVVAESTARLIPDVLGKEQLLKERITKSKGFIEYPQYTRPEVFDAAKYTKNWKNCPKKLQKTKSWQTPKVLMSGNHKKIQEWRQKHGKIIE